MAEGEELLDTMRWNWIAASEAPHDAGHMDLSLYGAELQKIEEARQTLGVLEQEKCMYLTAGEVAYMAGQTAESMTVLPDK